MNMRTTPAFAFALSLSAPLLSISLPVHANGEQLHADSNCFQCHDTSIYTRADRKAKDYAGVKRMVGFCRANLGVDWFPEEEAQVVEYLNDNFYRYSK
jgi:hypothetical protein